MFFLREKEEREREEEREIDNLINNYCYFYLRVQMMTVTHTERGSTTFGQKPFVRETFDRQPLCIKRPVSQPIVDQMTKS